MILRDAVHGLVAFESEEDAIVVSLLETKEVQRLRRIRQLGLTSLAFPGAEHTRFSHALGAAHVMQRFVARLRRIDGELPFWQRVTSERARDVVAAALLHDVGHGPLSHLFEDAMPGGERHETWTTRILLDESTELNAALRRDDAGLPRRVADLVMGRHEIPYLANLVSGTFDADRCDYLLRDAHATGVTYGSYDLDWLLRSLRFEPTSRSAVAPGLAIDGMKGITAIESFLLARLFMFQQVYFHKSTRAAEAMVRSILRRAVALVAAGERLPARVPALEAAAVSRTPTLAEYLELDDGVLLGAIHAWEDARDPVLSDLSKRLRARALFKTIELGGVESEIDPDEALRRASEIATARGLDPISYVTLDRAGDTPYPESADLSVIFPDGRSRDLADVSFLLGRLKGQRLSRTRLIFAAELRDDVRRALEQ
ncbi:MAG: HD domain-containing protein [Polyangiaceae bacterium]|nr:HD domain-containing protein [Polyangiaceae bacterium]